jgi:hypothetical protein
MAFAAQNWGKPYQNNFQRSKNVSIRCHHPWLKNAEAAFYHKIQIPGYTPFFEQDLSTFGQPGFITTINQLLMLGREADLSFQLFL